MRRWTTWCPAVVAALAALAVSGPPVAPACSLCDSAMRSQTTFRQEFEQAKIVLYGTLTNPQFNKRPGTAPGSGTTDFNIEKVLKNDPALAGRNKLEINKYIPVLDPKSPPKYVVFVVGQGRTA